MSDKSTSGSRRFLDFSGLLILVIAFIALILISNLTLRNLRLDITENNLYSISDGTRAVLENLEEPIRLKFFFSDEASSDLPSTRAYAQRVEELLEEYRRHADGMIELEVIDPLPFSEAEDQAAEFGLQPMQSRTATGEIYFGLAGQNEAGDTMIIPVFSQVNETFLEYDVTKLIYTLVHPEKPVVGLISGLPVSGGWNAAARIPAEPWIAFESISQLFEIRQITPDEQRVPEDVDLLLVIHPKNLSPAETYAIDQYILSGGKAMIFVDPLAETDTTAMDPLNPLAGGAGDRSSDLPALFAAWGIEYDPTRVVADRNLALDVGGARQHIAVLGLTADQLNQDDIVTGSLQLINVMMAGSLEPLPEATTTFTPLIETTDDATLLPVDRFFYLPDFDSLRDGYEPGGKPLVIAARIEGDVDSAFGEVPPAEIESGDAEHIPASQGPVNVVVVADADLLEDRLWVVVQSFFGQAVARAFADNGNLLSNGLENLTGSSDLISIRGGQRFIRPFEKVAELRRDADAAFRAKESELQLRLDETEQRLTELQSSGDDGQILTMNEEQSAEIERYMDQRLQIRKELRQVRHDLDRNIDGLRHRLALINILTVPLLLSLLALGIWLFRRHPV